MIRKLLLAAIFAVGLSAPALAQNTTCSNRPASDSSNACANTRFVQSHVAPPGGTNGQVQYNNAGAFGGFTFAGDCTLAIPNITCTKTSGVPFAPSATIDTTLAPNVNYTAPGTGAISQPVDVRLGKELWVNDFGAKCDNVTPDDTAFANAIAASVAQGKTLRFTGYCVLNNPLNVTSGPLEIQGVSPNVSVLSVLSSNDGIDIITDQRVTLKDFGISYQGARASAGTYAILKTSLPTTQSSGDRYENLIIYNAYVAIAIDRASVWIMKDCIFTTSTNGISIANTTNFDNGDMLVEGNTFTNIDTVPITYYGGGGLRLLSNKVAGNSAVGFIMALGAVGTPSPTTTSDFLAVGNSFESGAANSIGMQFYRSGSVVQFYNIVLTGNQFLMNTAIQVPTDPSANWITNMTIVGNTWLATGLPGGDGYQINSVNGLDISGGSAYSPGATTTLYVFGSAVTGKMIMPAMSGTFAAANSNSSTNMIIMNPNGTTFANLPAVAANGSQIYVTDGTPTSSPCTGGGTGATAIRQAGAWKCF